MQANGDSRNFVTMVAEGSPSALVAILLPRFYLGVIFLVAAYGKIAAGPTLPRLIAGYLNNVALVQGFPWYQWVVRSLVLPHVGLFAILIVLAELFVGLSMLLGVTTRWASIVAVILLLNYLCSKGMLPWMPASNDAADIVLATLVGALDIGVLRLDRWIMATIRTP